MMGLAVLFAVVIVVPESFTLGQQTERLLRFVEWTIWGAFAAEYAVLLAIAPDRVAFVRRRWFDLVVLGVPTLRLFRALRGFRALRLIRAVPFVSRALTELRTVFGRRGVGFVLACAVVLLLGGAALAYAAERGSGGGIETYGDALWWAFVTVTTVGYGEMSPATAAGRAVAVVLMLLGIAIYGTLTASVAALFVGRDGGTDERLDRLEAKMDELLCSIREGSNRDCEAGRRPADEPRRAV